MEDPVQYFLILSTVILSGWLATCLLRRYASPNSSSSSSSARVHALRLFPGDEIKTYLLNYCRQNSIEAAYIITCVGSLSKIHLRYAYSSGHFDKESWSRGQIIDGQFEILSMVGTIDGRGAGNHIHICLGDDAGNTRGGHLIGDAIVRTTAEIVLGQCENLYFTREFDEKTGFPELVVKPKGSLF